MGNILCGNKTHAHPTEFTLGVRELLVEGRLQQPSEAESPSLVIADPAILAVSEPSTKSAQKTLSDTDPDQGVTARDAQPRTSLGEPRPRANQPAHPGLGGDR
ncbi:Uncharacterized protein HSRCO_1535 [Halanaeroarchaeum sp. HSR-CO]|uniref:hypothetical protein n=1 Tax=Halanaeroarchaeum sp. HSR-CO TaxID=2866382 RepID=UPI00217E7978|nr:hypothetical protein [Halanaeroarchaeum sp. HSR-CO]UWG47816.1 Uncharacterized protein HSRCO_1535 [Halanaeroarchaeum sp. HSR-CO]